MNINESSIFGISVRALIAFTLVLCVCVMSLMGLDVNEPLYTLVIMGVSFYLGKSSNPVDNKNTQVDSTVITKSVPENKEK